MLLEIITTAQKYSGETIYVIQYDDDLQWRRLWGSNP